MIRITLEKDERTDWDGKTLPARVQVRDFETHAEACSWLVEDSYFEETYTRRMTWERIP
jgi:hypothetical protein